MDTACAAQIKGEDMKNFIEKQIAPVSSEVNALLSVVRPILTGILYAVKSDVVKEVGGYENVKIKMLPRLYRPGDGDVGISFEWAVHDAVKRNDPLVMQKIQDATKICRLPGNNYTSLLFGLEKSGRTRLIDTINEVITDESRLLTGTQMQPPKLKGYINQIAAAFSRPETRKALPNSINGLWKADLFIGTTDEDRWIATTLKINPSQLEGARGLRIGIVPASQGKSDKIKKDDSKNLIVCPLPYDGAYMELFYTGWRIVQQFIAADAKVPSEVALPNPPERQVARELEIRREYNLLEVVKVLEAQSQQGLLVSESKDVSVNIINEGETKFNDAIISPIARNI